GNNEGGNFHCDEQWLGVKVTTNNNLDSCDAYGNLISDPQFSNSSIGDFTLGSDSPCIDAGNNSYVTSVIDFVNNYRIWDGNNDNDSIVDIGCYEFGSQYNPVNIIDILTQSQVESFAFPNPVSGELNIKIENIATIEIYDLTGKKL
ncbi:T9SS type A sorting domain-containing protein, partial [Dolichospermum sp. ST_sed4]|nr:T9SS type A sorting domain-containing protein [Dolichospermum sp. ST_sed4]